MDNQKEIGGEGVKSDYVFYGIDKFNVSIPLILPCSLLNMIHYDKIRFHMHIPETIFSRKIGI
jgi:hypothetical protein